MDCLDPLEIAYVRLTGIVLFREEKQVSGIMAYQVYAIRSDQEIIVIRPGRVRHKRIGMCWLKEKTDPIYKKFLIPRTERIKFLINNIKIDKIYWKHKITENMMIRILESVTKSKEIYDN